VPCRKIGQGTSPSCKGVNLTHRKTQDSLQICLGPACRTRTSVYTEVRCTLLGPSMQNKVLLCFCNKFAEFLAFKTAGENNRISSALRPLFGNVSGETRPSFGLCQPISRHGLSSESSEPGTKRLKTHERMMKRNCQPKLCQSAVVR